MPGSPVGLIPVRTTSMRFPLGAALVAEWADATAEAHILELDSQVVGVGCVDLRDAIARPRLGRQPLRLERRDGRRGIEAPDPEADVVDVRHRIRAALVDAEKRVADGKIHAALLRALDAEAERALIERDRAVEIADDEARVVQRGGFQGRSGLSAYGLRRGDERRQQGNEVATAE